MFRFLLCLALLIQQAVAFSAHTEFYCNSSTGSNTYAGSTESGTPVFTTTGGNWATATGVFTKAGADLSGVSVGMFAAVMVDAGTVAARIGRITAVDNGADTITISTTAGSGSLADQTATATINVGGVWKGPNAAVGFPLGFVTNALMDASSNPPRVNLKNNATYSISAQTDANDAGPITWQGYTTTAGDGGLALIDGGANNVSLFYVSGAGNTFKDISVGNMGTTGGFAWAIDGARTQLHHCVAHNCRSYGFHFNAADITAVECEAYNCNISNNAGRGGFVLTNSGTFIRCISHDHTVANGNGFVVSAGVVSFRECIADTCVGIGYSISSTNAVSMTGCDAYNNTSDGIRLANATDGIFYIENCNLIDNGGYGINGSSATTRHGAIRNCGFGAGTAANTSGDSTGLSNLVVSGSVTYASNATPWTDPANGDFRISLATAKNAGRGVFTQTAASYAGAVGYPDIGAAQATASAGGVVDPFSSSIPGVP